MAYLLTRCAYDIFVILPKDVSFLTKLNGVEGYIKCTNRQGTSIFSYKEKDYDWINKSKDMVYTTLFGIDTNKESTPLRHTVSPSSGFHFERGGIVEPATYTVFEVLMNIDSETIDSEKMELYHKLSMNLLRTFIEKYRYVTQDNSLVIPDENDFLIIEYFISEEMEEDGLGILFKPLNIKYNNSDVLQRRKNKKVSGGSSFDIFADYLKNDKELELYKKLLMESKEHSLIHNDHQISIIKSQTAFEVFIQNLLINLCEEKQIYKLKVGRCTKDYKEAIFNGNIRETLIKKYLKDFLNQSIAGTREYNDWYQDCYVVRNSIVHRGSDDLSEVDAKAAFESVNAFINYIENILAEM